MFENFFTVTDSFSDGELHRYFLELNLDHEIYKAHFPASPITPGACQLEIVRRMADLSLSCQVRILEIKNLKYLQVIDPLKSARIVVEETFFDWEADHIRCNVVIFGPEGVYTKASIVFGR